MKAQVETLSSIERKLDVTIDGDDVLKELSRAYSRLSHQVKIPGFRKGKVPRQVLERYYKSDVEGDVLSRLVNKSFVEAIDEHELQPVNQPEIKNSEFIPGQDFRYTARVEVRPELKIENYKGLDVTRPEVSVPDADVDAELERRRGMHAQVLPVEDREQIEKGDLVVCNFKGRVEGEEFQGGNGLGYVMDTAEGNFLPEVIEALPGRTVGEKFEVEAKLPEDFNTAEVAGKTATFEITPVQIKVKKLPELDDDFAKDLGEFDTLDELKASIREQLEKRAADESEHKFKDDIIAALVERHPFDVPPSLIERQLDLMLYQTLGGIAPEQLRSMGLDMGKMRDELRERAEQRVRRGMVLEALADQEKIEASDDEIDAKFAEIAERVGQPLAKVKGSYNAEHLEELRFSLRLDKAMDLIIDNLGETAAPAQEDKA